MEHGGKNRRVKAARRINTEDVPLTGTAHNSIKRYLSGSDSEDDDFLTPLDALIEKLLHRDTPRELYLVRVNNWFDHKWLKFSGVGSHDFRFPAYMNRVDSAKEEVWKENMTSPPFTPARILTERYFHRVNNTYAEAEPPELLHSRQRQPSHMNLQRRISEKFDSAMFVWYSANTLANDRASLMIYRVSEGVVIGWFAAFRRSKQWKVDSTKGIDRDELKHLFE